MNPAQAQASGTKPGQLNSPIPGQNEQQSSEAGAQSGLSQLAKTKPQPTQPPVVAPGQQQQQDPMAELEAQQQAEDKAKQDANQNDEYDGVDVSGRPIINKSYTKEQAAGATADLVEGGIPLAINAVGTGVGAYFGNPRGGSAASSALNVALAPHIRDLADKIREKAGIPKSDKTDFEASLQSFIGEFVGNAAPTIINHGKYAVNYIGEKLAREEGVRVAENIATINKLKNQGLKVGTDSTTGVFKGTYLDPNVQALKDQPNLSAAQQQWNDFADQVGSSIDENGNRILTAKNFSEEKRIVGKNIGNNRELLAHVTDDKMVDPSVLLQSSKEIFERMGFKTDNGEIPEEMLKNMSGEQRAFATKMNSEVERIKMMYLEGNTGKTLEAEQVKHMNDVPKVDPNFNGTPDPMAAASHQDTLPGQQMNTGAPMEVKSSSNPTGANDIVTPQSGTQGSLGLAEQSDHMNQVVGKGKDGKDITLAQLRANKSLDTFNTDGVETFGIKQSDLHNMIQDIGTMANFNGKERSLTEHQLGEVYHELSTLRDNITASGFKDAADKAALAGDSEAAAMFNGKFEETKNLSTRYSVLSKIETKFVTKLEQNPDEAVKFLAQKLPNDQLRAFVSGATPETQGAIRNLYVKNAINDSSSGGVLLDPEKMRTRVYKDREAIDAIFGEDGKETFDRLGETAKNAIDIDSKLAAGNGIGAKSAIVRKALGYWKDLKLANTDILDALFARAPNIKRDIQQTQEYIAAYQRYSNKNISTADKISYAKDLAAPLIKGSAVTKAAAFLNDNRRTGNRLDKQNQELNMSDLENGK